MEVKGENKNMNKNLKMWKISNDRKGQLCFNDSRLNWRFRVSNLYSSPKKKYEH